MDRKNRWTLLLLSGLLAFSLSACPKKQQVKKNIDLDKETAENANKDQVESEDNELDIHGKDFVESKDVGVIYFDYDSNQLSDEARKILSANAEFLKNQKDIEILTEGHCDERGTVGYNLALGQRRAATVRKYYISLGLNPKKIGSVSFGKEKPVCVENTEECWAKNRRGLTKIRTLKVVDNGKDKNQDIK